MPLTALIRYQPEPDLDVGQTALQLPPLTVTTTVTVSDGASRVLIAAPRDALVRMLTALQAGMNVPVAAFAAFAAYGPTRNPASTVATSNPASHGR